MTREELDRRFTDATIRHRPGLADNFHQYLPVWLDELAAIADAHADASPDSAPDDAAIEAWIDAHPNEFNAWARKQNRINGGDWEHGVGAPEVPLPDVTSEPEHPAERLARLEEPALAPPAPKAPAAPRATTPRRPAARKGTT